jgi:hypothetical protein
MRAAGLTTDVIGREPVEREDARSSKSLGKGSEFEVQGGVKLAAK